MSTRLSDAAAPAISPSDLEEMARLTSERNAAALEHKRLFEEKFPGSVEPGALQAPATEYAIKSYNFSYVAFFYVKVWCDITYETGETRRFEGSGGGVGIGDGMYWGGDGTTKFALSPKEIEGRGCEFYLQPVSIGALIHFWSSDLSFGTLVGAGPAVGIGAFGGSGTWRA